MREAAFEYRDIKQLHIEILSYKDDASIQCEAALKKISSLLDKYVAGQKRFRSLLFDFLMQLSCLFFRSQDFDFLNMILWCKVGAEH